MCLICYTSVDLSKIHTYIGKWEWGCYGRIRQTKNQLSPKIKVTKFPWNSRIDWVSELICIRSPEVKKTVFECFTVATMNWLTAMKYLCHKWPQICSTCRKQFPVLFSFNGFVTRLTRLVPPGRNRDTGEILFTSMINIYTSGNPFKEDIFNQEAFHYF
jgi:hypothetical protein